LRTGSLSCPTRRSSGLNELASDGELSMVKNYMLGDMCRSYESAFSLADAWIFVQVSGLQDTYFAEALDAVKEVTPQEIRELAGRSEEHTSELQSRFDIV